MNHRERITIAILLGFVAAMVSIDISTDFSEGVAIWHVLAEAIIGISALAGLFYILRGSIIIRQQLHSKQIEAETYKVSAEKWKSESKKFVEGLSLAIDHQLTKWSLTSAEKEVALLLLKGLSLKEIADIRNTTEKTARVQSMAIYSKSGLAGRSELSAFFLEDLLAPLDQSKESDKVQI